MQPVTPRDFLKVALQRLAAAEAIMDKLRLSLDKLPPETQRDIVTLFTFAPSELTPETFREFMQNAEFDDPSPTMLE